MSQTNGRFKQMLAPALRCIGDIIASLPSGELRRRVVGQMYERDPEAVFDAIVAMAHGPMKLDDLPFDLQPHDRLDFEDLVGLFPNTPFTYGVSLMTPRQLGYLFGLARRSNVRTAVEIGRYKGGSTLVIAAALGSSGAVWSIDNGAVDAGPANHDAQLMHICNRFKLNVHILTGDSRTLQLDCDPIDLLLIDADHSYEGAKLDFTRWSARVPVGGHVIMDDAFPGGSYTRHAEAVNRVVQEATKTGRFQLVCVVDRMAHLQRTN